MTTCCSPKSPISNTLSSVNLDVPMPGVSVKSMPNRSAISGPVVWSVFMLTRMTSDP